MKEVTEFSITEKPGPMALVVETTPFTIHSQGDEWVARKSVTYLDSTVNVTIIFRGQTGQEYKMTMTINEVEKKIEGELEENGINKITKDFPLSDFNL